MSSKLRRRDFLLKTSAACMGSCFLLSGKDMSAFAFQADEVIDPNRLCYCSYSCPQDCHFLEASLKDDARQKKAAFEEWGLGERYGMVFDAEKIFCFKCKPGDKPEGPVLAHCTVRSCVIEKGYRACIECGQLTCCDKDLWKRFPQFHEQVIKMQDQFWA